MRRLAVVFCLLTFAAAAQEAELSASKLGPHYLGSYTEGGKAFMQAGPRVIKVLDPQSNGAMLQAMRDYKARYPEGVVVMRVWEGTPAVRFDLDDDPARSAQAFWRIVLEPAWRALSATDRKLVDYLEGPNEGENGPTWQDVASARWFGAFWAELAGIIAEAGVKPCAASIPVGNPGGDPGEVAARFRAFLPGLAATARHDGAWSYHAYSVHYGTDVGVERDYALRYRRLHDVLSAARPDLAHMPLILTEAGVDFAGDPAEDGWQARGAAERYMDWLRWFDARLREDDYVFGATLFAIGDPNGWPSFDLEPVAEDLALHLKRAG